MTETSNPPKNDKSYQGIYGEAFSTMIAHPVSLMALPIFIFFLPQQIDGLYAKNAHHIAGDSSIGGGLLAIVFGLVTVLIYSLAYLYIARTGLAHVKQERLHFSSAMIPSPGKLFTIAGYLWLFYGAVFGSAYLVLLGFSAIPESQASMLASSFLDVAGSQGFRPLNYLVYSTVGIDLDNPWRLPLMITLALTMGSIALLITALFFPILGVIAAERGGLGAYTRARRLISGYLWPTVGLALQLHIIYWFIYSGIWGRISAAVFGASPTALNIFLTHIVMTLLLTWVILVMSLSYNRLKQTTQADIFT